MKEAGGKLDILFASVDEKGKTDGPRVWTKRMAAELASRGFRVGVAILKMDSEKGSLEEALESEAVVVLTQRRRNHRADAQWFEETVLNHGTRCFVAQHVAAALTASWRLRPLDVETFMIIHSDDTIYWRLSSFYLQRPDPGPKHVVCVSKYLLEKEAEKRTAEKGYELHCVPYGVEVHGKEQRTDAGQDIRLIYVGRLDQRQKRILDVVKALCRACDEIDGVRATVVGSGHDEVEARQLAAHSSGGDKVEFRGMLSIDETRREMEDHEVIVLLSDFEGLPISLMEAMGAGLVPVVTEMRSGVPELVEDGVTGVVVKDRGDAFVGAIRKLAGDRGLAKRLGLTAAGHIKEGYSLEFAAEFWSGLIRNASVTEGALGRNRAFVRKGYPSGLWREPTGDPSVAPLLLKPLAMVFRVVWNFWIRIPVAKRAKFKRIIRRRDAAPAG